MTDDKPDPPATPVAEEAETGEVTLTNEQRDALVLDRNVVITAGAGTGKTTALTQRYLTYLREDPTVTPTNIVTITFTRKAAAELQTRVREEVYEQLAAADSAATFERWRGVLDELEDGYMHTIHAFCARILREHAIQAPVPMGFDVLDEDDAADLQRQVVVEYVDAAAEDGDVELLSRLFGSHARLVDVLTGLLDARPESEAWVDHWGDRDVDAYMNYLWERVCALDPDTARSFFARPAVEDALDTARRFAQTEFTVDSGADGIDVLQSVAAITDDLGPDATDRDYQRACRELYDLLETSSGGLYASASHHLVGTKATWNDETDAYSACKDALNALLDNLSDIEDAVETTPGALERNSAPYVFALARVFDAVLEAYDAEKEDQGALDFPDLIETTIRFLRSTPGVRASLRESFEALLVDEFQDTDDRQWELVSLLAGLTDDDTATENVFLVGDKKQSIYGFRGADVTTFETAKRALREQNRALGRDALPDGKQSSPTSLELSGNFRTLATPLGFLNEVFEHVFEPEGDTYADYEAESQTLSFERRRVETVDDLTGTVEYLAVPETQGSAAALLGADHPVTDAAVEHSIAAEAEALGARLSALLADPPDVQDRDTGRPRSARPDDIAILLRRRTHLDRYQRALDAWDLPYTVVSGVGFYDTPEVQTLITLLRVLADPTDDVSLYGVLRSPLFGFTDDRLAHVGSVDAPLWETIQQTDDQALRNAADLITEWRTLAGCVRSEGTDVRPWNRVLTRVFEDTGYLVSIGADESGQQAVANVEKFRDEIRQWSENGVRTAASLLRRIDRQAELDPREGEADIPAGTDGIRLMTIHAAKGLEFPIVAVPDLGSDLNFGRSIDDYGYVRLVTDHDDQPFLTAGGPDPDDPFDVQKTTAHRYADTVERPRERAEAKRLLYVAATRTRDHLLLCGTHEFDVQDGEVSVANVADPEDASAWRDWLQPLLVDRSSVLEQLSSQSRVSVSLGDAEYTVQLPTNGVPWTPEAGSETDAEYPAIELPSVPTQTPRRRVTATQLVEAASDYDPDDQATVDDSPDATDETSTATTLAGNELGTVVHRLLELDPPRDRWRTTIRQIANQQGFDMPDAALDEVVSHAEAGRRFLASQADTYDCGEVYEELSVSVDVANTRIIGDIDHLRVTPDEFVIIDNKTNTVGPRTTEELASHYRPQMMSYAAALLAHDPDRRVTANLYFTDVGVTELFSWTEEDREMLTKELHSLVDDVE